MEVLGPVLGGALAPEGVRGVSGGVRGGSGLQDCFLTCTWYHFECFLGRFGTPGRAQALLKTVENPSKMRLILLMIFGLILKAEKTIKWKPKSMKNI